MLRRTLMDRYRLLLPVLTLSSIPFCLVAAQSFPTLDGSWRGKLSVASISYPTAQDSIASPNYRIEINNKNVQVYRDEKEVKPGAFRIEQHKTNAIVFAMDSGKDNEGLWVETWVFAITLKDPNTIIVDYDWLVNNTDLPTNNDHSKISTVATGEFHRSP